MSPFFCLWRNMNKLVTVTFEDKDSLTVQEIQANLQAVYGKNAEVKVNPSSHSPTSHIYFGISELLTEEQALIFYDQPELYNQKLKKLRKEVIRSMLFILNDVIMDNEERFSS